MTAASIVKQLEPNQVMLIASMLVVYCMWWLALVVVRVGQFTMVETIDADTRNNPIAAENPVDATTQSVPYDNSDTRAQQAKLNGIYKRALNVS
jgi:hypothetical protein